MKKSDLGKSLDPSVEGPGGGGREGWCGLLIFWWILRKSWLGIINQVAHVEEFSNFPRECPRNSIEIPFDITGINCYPCRVFSSWGKVNKKIFSGNNKLQFIFFNKKMQHFVRKKTLIWRKWAMYKSISVTKKTRTQSCCAHRSNYNTRRQIQ